MEKQEMETSGVVEGNLDKITTLFPQCITEVSDSDGTTHRVVDFDKLRKELGDDTVEGVRERYQFTWPQKSIASALANTKTRMTLRPVREGSVNFDTTENLYIEGDNLEVLKVLRETYLGRVKMIYIDPPYNTGKDFVYKDRRFLTKKQMDDYEGKFDEYGNVLIANTDANGRFHTDWLNFMYPRLKVARDLMASDGMIFISIDNAEINNLQKICNEIFGESEYIGTLVLKTATDNNPSQINTEHEYMLCYARDKSIIAKWKKKSEAAAKIIEQYENLKNQGLSISEIQEQLRSWIKRHKDELPQVSHYNNVDEKGVYSSSGNSSNPHPGGYTFDIIHPVTKQACPKPANGWRWPKDTFKAYADNGEVEWGMDHTTQPHIKKRIETAVDSLRSIIYEDNRASTKMLVDLFDGKKIFDNPKPLNVIKNIIEFVTDTDSLIMDFFSGSATTAHAVLKLNAEDGGQRKFIMVQLAEKTPEDSEANKAGYNTICEIGEERIRRAGKKVKEDMPENSKDLDTGFRVLRLDTSNMKDVFYNPAAVTQYTLDDMVTNVKEDRSDEDLLFQVMLQNNIPLSSKIEKINVNGHEAFNVNDGDFIAIFDRSFDDATLVELAKMEPLKFVMREPEGANGVNPDNLIDNFEQKFELYSPNTQRRIL